MKNNLNILLIVGVFFLVLSCSSRPTETQELKRGRLKYIKTLKFGSVGTHGSQGWYVSNRELKVDNRDFEPEGIKVKEHIANCEGSPTESIEALKCHSFANGKESVYILRIKDDKPEWIIASDLEYESGDNLGTWIGDGHWLLFTSYFYHIETSEKREIKGLPDDPGNYFRSISPDFETIVYNEGNFSKRSDYINVDKITDEKKLKQWDLHNQHIQNGMAVFWLIEVKTGKINTFELSKDKYNWAFWNREKFNTYDKFIDFCWEHLVWEKDKNGKYQLIVQKLAKWSDLDSPDKDKNTNTK